MKFTKKIIFTFITIIFTFILFSFLYFFLFSIAFVKYKNYLIQIIEAKSYFIIFVGNVTSERFYSLHNVCCSPAFPYTHTSTKRRGKLYYRILPDDNFYKFPPPQLTAIITNHYTRNAKYQKNIIFQILNNRESRRCT